MKTIFTLLAVVCLFCCRTGIPLTTGPSENNKAYEVEYLFEHDGCKVYRFLDCDRYVYFTNCRSDVTSFVCDTTDERIENHVRLEDFGSEKKKQ